MLLLSGIFRSVSHELRTIRGALYRRIAGRNALPPGVIDAFHKNYFDARDFNLTWRNTHWLGHAILKCPLDLWLYQEIVHRLRPSLIVETGTAFGGSALYMASMCDLVGHGKVVTIDLTPQPNRPEHPRITYVNASSTDPETVERVRGLVDGSGPVMVILDSDHRMEHVAAELELYHPFVTSGSYLIVEDTNLNGHPVEPEHGPGPMEAMRAFVENHAEFTHDSAMDKFLMSFNPKGFLRRR
jgi:cephalosporin hydroxylase